MITESTYHNYKSKIKAIDEALSISPNPEVPIELVVKNENDYKEQREKLQKKVDEYEDTIHRLRTEDAYYGALGRREIAEKKLKSSMDKGDVSEIEQISRERYIEEIEKCDEVIHAFETRHQKFQREHRYAVFKLKRLTESERQEVFALQEKLLHAQVHECVIVEHDWPEYEPTWKAIQERVESENART